MKKNSRSKKQRASRARAALPGQCLVGAALLVGVGLARAEEQDNSIFEGGTNTFNNWIEISAGGLITSGNRSAAEQARRLPARAFGGIEDLHLQYDLGKKVGLTVDGHGIYDNDNYGLSLGLKKEETWFLKVNAQNFRTWYDADGGYYPPGSVWYPIAGGALGLDRREISFEGGLTLKKLPSINFKYTHLERDGQKSSTSWGQTHPLLDSVVRGIGPSFYDIDETRDIFELNFAHRIKTTDLGLGLRYETGDLDNTRFITQYPGEPVERKVANREDSSYDLFSLHFFTETWVKKNLFLTSGYLFDNVCSDFSGNRIYGDDFDVSYAPNALNGAGYNNLDGSGSKQEHVVNLNLMWKVSNHLTVTPSVRVQKEDWNADSGVDQTLGNNAPGFLASNSDGNALDVRERLDVRYTGITNAVLYAQGEWTEGDGDLNEAGSIYLNGPIQRTTEDSRWFQKYTAGCRLYPRRSVSIDLGGYYKRNAYDYDHSVDSTANNGGNRYPAYLTFQDFETFDGYARLTLRVLPNLSLVSRYEYQESTVHTRPDSASGLAKVESSDMTSHIFAQNVSWTPWSRLYLQAGFNYVTSETETPVSSATESALDAANGANFTQAILNAQNNYWTLNFNAGFVLDQKTDLNLGYTYYRADDYTDYSEVSLPLGAGAEEHGVSATVVRRINEHLRVSLRYGFYHSVDEPSGGNRDYDAHLVYASAQYRF